MARLAHSFEAIGLGYGAMAEGQPEEGSIFIGTARVSG